MNSSEDMKNIDTSLRLKIEVGKNILAIEFLGIFGNNELDKISILMESSMP